MVRHVVWWTFTEEALDKVGTIRKELLALTGAGIPGLRGLDVSEALLPTSTEEVTLILSSLHDDAAALKIYAEHPAHVAVGTLLKGVVTSRRAIDYEFDA